MLSAEPCHPRPPPGHPLLYHVIPQRRLSARRVQPSLRPQLLPGVHRRCLGREKLLSRLLEPCMAERHPENDDRGEGFVPCYGGRLWYNEGAGSAL